MRGTVFLDTVGLLALWDTRDQWHQGARTAFERLRAERAELVTSTLVLAECGNAAARKPYRLDVAELREKLEAHNRLLRLDERDWQAAWQAYRSGVGAAAGLVDQLSFIVARRLGIRRIFTNDAHFRTAGFEVLF